jgi:hypothetical protein
MNAQEIQEEIMAECKKLQRENPSWAFAPCYSEVQRTRPELFKDPEVVQESARDAQNEMRRQKEGMADRQLKEHQQAVYGAESEESPTLKLAKKLMAAQTQQEITNLCSDIMQANPGMTFSTAYALAQNKRPELFRDEMGRDPIEREEKASEVSQKQAAIHAEIEKMLANDPHLTFKAAFNRLIASKPELFNFDGLDSPQGSGNA